MTISCVNGARIRILSANYGRASDVPCGQINAQMKCGNGESSYAKVSEKCNNKSQCSFFVNNSFFGDPCGGVSKYLETEWICSQ